jgi:hypothetical protein
MGERSASDREGVGSTPTSGPHMANPGYAAFRLAKALTTAEQHHDAETRERAKHKADKWLSVFTQMVGGSLQVGSRTPLDKVPTWVTLEVVTGGFATGSLLAGGPLLPHERALAAQLGLPSDPQDRSGLNRHFLTDEGLGELLERVKEGTYDVGVPEEAALLVVAWLTDNNHGEEARELLSQLAPFFTQLRFYPQPTERPQRFGSRVFIQDVNTTIESLRAIRPNTSIAAQKESIEVWTPLYDELIGLFLETVEGPPPNLRSGLGGERLPRENGRFPVEGGWPCRAFNDSWNEHAKDFLRRFELQRKEHSLSSKPRHRKSSLAQLVPYLTKCISNPASLSGRDVGRVRLHLARYIAKRGVPDSEACRSVRELQARQAETPMYHKVAAVIIPRLQRYPGKNGIEDLRPVTESIAESESVHCGLAPGRELPETIRRKIERCLRESIEVLVERGLITSGDVLAKVLPQLTSGLRAAGITDPVLRQLYAATYRAFRQRRSLLLLDLQSQVKIEELPWVAAIEQFRSENLSTHELARQTLDEVVSLTLVSFPQAIVPNKLLQELRALVSGAGIDIPLVDELAADIFMGEFSPKFVRAAKQAADLMSGTLYQTYYGIDYAEVLRLPAAEKNPSRSWFSRSPPTQDDFATLCRSRAGVTQTGWDPATNGMVIEQQQIVTTQNLASLFTGLGLADTLRPYLADMARRCFEWICRRQQVKATDWHARLIMIKNTAYSWRQMMFYLSFITDEELADFTAWASNHLSSQEAEFQTRFRPAFDGLIAASNGRTPDRVDANVSGGRQFQGWSKSRHWLLG